MRPLKSLQAFDESSGVQLSGCDLPPYNVKTEVYRSATAFNDKHKETISPDAMGFH